jgi:putrescine transport system substrate-binding protein
VTIVTRIETCLRRLAAALALSAGLAGAASAEEGVLHIYNWTDYIGETTIADFEKETGIKVVYDTYAKLLAGRSGYDLVVHSASMAAKLMPAGAFLEIDKAKLKNLGNLDPAMMQTVAGFDPGNRFGIPYMWGTAGVAYNTDMIKERMADAPMDSLDMLFKPELAQKWADCGISVLESPTDMIPMALAYLGKDPNSEDPADYDAVVELFEPIRQYIKTFDSANYLNALPNEEICLAFSWSGDYATASTRAEEAGAKVNLEYHVPKTGSPAWVDMWLIPKDAENAEAALKFIDYMLRPDVIAAATNYTNYANAIPSSNSLVSKDILENPAIYPDEATTKLLWTPKVLSQAGERARTRAWSRIKTGQ